LILSQRNRGPFEKYFFSRKNSPKLPLFSWAFDSTSAERGRGRRRQPAGRRGRPGRGAPEVRQGTRMRTRTQARGGQPRRAEDPRTADAPAPGWLTPSWDRKPFGEAGESSSRRAVPLTSLPYKLALCSRCPFPKIYVASLLPVLVDVLNRGL
jgi:hypothetical protein